MFRVVVSLLLLTYFSISISAQERISDFKKQGSSSKYYLEEEGGVHYLFEVTPQSNVTVKELLGPEVTDELFSLELPGLYDAEFVFFDENRLLFASQSAIGDYDFVNNEFVEHVYPDGVNFAYVIDEYGDDKLMSLQDGRGGLSYTVLYNRDNGIEILSDSLIYTNMHGDYFVVSKRSDDFPYDKYILNRNTGEEVLFWEKSTFYQEYHFDDEHIYYLDISGHVIRHKLGEQQGARYTSLEVELESANAILKRNDTLLVINTSSRDESRFTAYSITEDRVIKTTVLEQAVDVTSESFNWVANKVFTLSDNHIVVVDIINGDNLVHKCYHGYFYPYKVIDNEFIISISYDFPRYGFDLINISTLNVSRLAGEFELTGPEVSGFWRQGNQVVGVFEWSRESYAAIYNYDLDDKTAVINTILDKTSEGFKSGSELVMINGALTLLSDRVYDIDDKTLTNLQTPVVQDIRGEEYRVEGDNLYFIQENPKRLYRYDGSESHLVADFKNFSPLFGSNRIDDFGEQDDYILFSNSGFYVYRYDKTTEEVVQFDEVNALVGKQFFAHGNFMYYANFNGLIQTDGVNKEVIISDLSDDVVSDRMSVMGDQLLVIGKNGIYSIDKEGVVSSIIEVPTLYGPSFFKYNRDSSVAFINVGNSMYIHYDGVNATPIDVSESILYYLNTTIDDLFLFEKGSHSDVSFYYDIAEKLIKYFPLELEGRSVITAFTHIGDDYLVVMDDVREANVFSLYQWNREEESVDLIFNDTGFVNRSSTNYVNVNELGLLQVGNVLYAVNSRSQFNRIDTVSGNLDLFSAVDYNERIYFLGVDDVRGRQLYFLDSISTEQEVREEEEQVIGEDSELFLYPNPVNNLLRVTLDRALITDDSPGAIYSIRGEHLMNARLKDSYVDVSDLASGLYMLRIECKGEVFNRKFWVLR